MKIIIAIIILIWSGIQIYCQDIPYDSNTGKITFENIVEISDSSISKLDLYNHALSWVINEFGKVEDVVQLNDPNKDNLLISSLLKYNTEVIVGNKTFMTEQQIKFSLTIYFKKGKYKYKITDLYQITSSDWGQTQSPAEIVFSKDTEENALNSISNKNMQKNLITGWKNNKLNFFNAIQSLIQSLNNYMSTLNNSIDDW